jgi:uncharacterized membrane protein
LASLEEYTRGKSYRELVKIYRDIVDGKLVIEDPDPPSDYYSYLTRLDYSAWLWICAGLLVFTLVSIGLSDSSPVFAYARYILGTIFVLFLPGYLTIEALYPGDNELGDLERLALSIGLSLALVPLIGLVLNYTPWGIRLTPVLVSLTMYSAILAFTASYRKYMLLRKTVSRGLSKSRRK